jgi:hypothetical protein
MLRYADPPQCALGSAFFCRLLIVPTVRTRDRPAVHCVKALLPHSEAPHRSRCARWQVPAVAVYGNIHTNVLAVSPSPAQVCTPRHRCLNRRVTVRAS